MDARADFDAACFLAAAGAGAAVDVGRGGGKGTFAADEAAGGRVAGGVPGSGVMMLTGGIEVEVGNSALVGLPVGTDGGSVASGAAAGAADAGAFHDGA